MSFLQPLGQLRSPVSTYASLPLTGNVKGDVRLTLDTGDAYTWLIENTSGLVTDWKKVTSSSYSELIGAPFSTALDIDNAVKVVTGLAINISLLAFNTLTGFGAAIAKMFDGIVHQFNSDDSGLDLGDSSNYTQIDNTFYMPNKGDLDIYTKMLIHGDGVQGSQSFVDLIRHTLYDHNAITDTAIKKFGTGSIKFNGTNASVDLGRLVENDGALMNYTEAVLDFWFYSLASGLQPILSNDAYSGFTSYSVGEVADIKRLANGHISASLLVTTDMGMTQTTISVEGTAVIADNAWNHIAIQRIADGHLQIWVNGVLDATSSTAMVPDEGTYYPVLLVLGKRDTAYLNGYLDEIRISNITRYTTTFTPMTKAYNTATTPAPTPIIVDISSSAHPVVVHGGARMSGTNPLFGNASLYLDGVNSYLSSPVNVLFNGDFERWTGSNVDGWSLSYYSAGCSITKETSIKKSGNYSLKCTGDGTYFINTFELDNWIALSENISNFRGKTITFGAWVYANAPSIIAFTLADDDINTPNTYAYNSLVNTWEWITGTMTVSNTANYLVASVVMQPANPVHVGYIDGTVVVEGSSIPASMIPYDSNDFQLCEPVGLDSNVKLLLHFDSINPWIDSATGKTITNPGTYPVTNSSPSKFGAYCGYFNGNSYLSVPDSDDFYFGTGNFTIDVWIKPDVINTAGIICGQQPLAYSQWVFQYKTNVLEFYSTDNASNIVYVTCPFTPTLGQWHHVAVVRNGNTWLLFVNGVSQTVTLQLGSYSASVINQVSPLTIGRDWSGILFHNGKMDELRISKGIARWTANFIPPTKAYSDVLENYTVDLWIDPLQLTDLNTFIIGQDDSWKLTLDGTSNHYPKFQIGEGIDSYTKLMLHFDTPTPFVDATGKTVTNLGTYPVSNALPSKFGAYCGYFTGSSYLSVPDSDDFYFGTGNFTIDTWIKYDSLSGDQVICGQFLNSSNQWQIYKSNTTNKLSFYWVIGGVIQGQYIMTSNWSASINTWYHIAIVRNSTNMYLYINGNSEPITELVPISTKDVGNVSAPLEIGRYSAPGSYFNGKMDELRISKGIARWTSNFTPPTSSYSLVSSVIAPISLSLETWQHVAIVQKDGTIKLYVNGVLGASIAGSAIINRTNALTVGADSNAQHLFNGFIEEVRISKGIARWTAPFTPPSVEYSSDSNTKLLLPLNVQTVPNMVLQSVGYVSNYVPTSARVVIFEEDIDVMEPNVDLVIEISRDGGTTFTTCLIAKDQEFGDGTLNLFSGSVDLSSQPNGELMVWRLTTQNNKDCRIRGISLNWR